MTLRSIPARGQAPKLFFGDVVSTPMLREAIVLREVSGRWLLRYTDDGSEVVLQAKLLALVRRVTIDAHNLLDASAQVIAAAGGPTDGER